LQKMFSETLSRKTVFINTKENCSRDYVKAGDISFQKYVCLMSNSVDLLGIYRLMDECLSTYSMLSRTCASFHAQFYTSPIAMHK
jgi:hypothetical protein